MTGVGKISFYLLIQHLLQVASEGCSEIWNEQNCFQGLDSLRVKDFCQNITSNKEEYRKNFLECSSKEAEKYNETFSMIMEIFQLTCKQSSETHQDLLVADDKQCFYVLYCQDAFINIDLTKCRKSQSCCLDHLKSCKERIKVAQGCLKEIKIEAKDKESQFNHKKEKSRELMKKQESKRKTRNVETNEDKISREAEDNDEKERSFEDDENGTEQSENEMNGTVNALTDYSEKEVEREEEVKVTEGIKTTILPVKNTTAAMTFPTISLCADGEMRVEIDTALVVMLLILIDRLQNGMELLLTS